MVLVTASGITGITLASALPASAQASCTGSSAYTNAGGHLVFVPTIGSDTHRDNCDLGLGNDSNAVFWLQTTLNNWLRPAPRARQRLRASDASSREGCPTGRAHNGRWRLRAADP
jgi:hypothetical protein